MQEAAATLESALAVRERLFGPNNFLVAETLIRLGLIQSRQGRLAEAEQCKPARSRFSAQKA
jgi:hypothetical protein